MIEKVLVNIDLIEAEFEEPHVKRSSIRNTGLIVIEDWELEKIATARKAADDDTNDDHTTVGAVDSSPATPRTPKQIQSLRRESGDIVVSHDSTGRRFGLGVAPFTSSFDEHFRIDSAKILALMAEVEDGMTLSMSLTYYSEAEDLKTLYGTMRQSHARKDEFQNSLAAPKQWFIENKHDPRYWGLSVEFISKTWTFIKEDIINYSNAHWIDGEGNHVCLVPRCRWHHAGATVRKRPSLLTSCNEYETMAPNMHLVVSRYVKPWTTKFNNAGLALLLNAGATSVHKQDSVEQKCKADVFVSHSWNEYFEVFTTSLRNALGKDIVVWVCSFAIWQHGEISVQLNDLEACPFAVALKQASRCLLVLDSDAEAIRRCWCVFEAELAQKWEKPYDMCLHDDMDADSWQKAGTKIQKLDIEQCLATVPKDKEAILDYARDNVPNGVSGLNQQVRNIAKAAADRATLMAAAANGDWKSLMEVSAEELRLWRSVRGRTLLHVASSHGQIAVMELLMGIDQSLLDALDSEQNSALTVAASVGALASVHSLLEHHADVQGHSKDGMTPLHFAAQHNLSAVAAVLLAKQADVGAPAKFQNVYGRQPLHVAAREGNNEVVRVLAKHRADVNARADNGLSVLFHAVTGMHTDALASLIALRANVNLANGDSFRRTPLMGAVSRNSHAMVSILLNAAADVTLRDAKNQSLEDYLSWNAASHDAQCVRTLVKQACVPSSKRRPYHCSCSIS